MAIGDYTDVRMIGPVSVPVSVANAGPPANFIWIIKQILIVNTNPSGTVGVQCAIETSPANNANARVVDINIQPRDVEMINTHLVLSGATGDKFVYVSTAGTQATITVCGLARQIS